MKEKKITIGHKPDGAPIRKSFYGKTDREINAKIQEYTKQAAYGTIDRKITLADWADKWLATYKDGNVRSNTYETTYRISVDKIKDYFKQAKLYAIRPLDIQAFFNDMSNMSQSGLNKLRITLKAIFESAIENELVVRNPVQKSIKPKSEQKPSEKRAYTKEEVAEIIAFAKTHPDGAAVITILKTGLRRGELCGLQWSDVDLKSNTITVRHAVTMAKGSAILGEPKTKSSKREIPFDDELKSVLLSIPRKLHCDFVFSTVRGCMLNPDNWSDRNYAGFMKDYETYYKEEYKKIHNEEPKVLPRLLNPHELRHTFATILCASSMNIDATSKILGHSDISITSKLYVHTDIEAKREAIAKILPFNSMS